MDIARWKSLQHQVLWLAVAGGALLAASCGGEDPVGPTPDPEPTNTAPVAQAGPDQTVSATLPVSLDGSSSTDADGDAITYVWSIASAPSGSTAGLDDATSATPTFTPDVAGAYTVSLVVNDGTENSAADEATITAEDNTSTETIGAGGGTIASADGALTLEIPAGALAADEEISITMVSGGQVPEELDEVKDGALMYEMRPDGLQFAEPVRVEVLVPAGIVTDPTTSAEGIQLGQMMTRSDGVIEPAGDQEIERDGDSDTLIARGEISHFSTVAWVRRAKVDGAWKELILLVLRDENDPIFTAFVGQPFRARTLLSIFAPDGIVEARQTNPDPSITATMIDASELPIEIVKPVDGTLEQRAVDWFEMFAFNSYVCHETGFGVLRSLVTVSGPNLGDPEGQNYEFNLSYPARIECLLSDTPFEAVTLPDPEGFGLTGPTIKPTIDEPAPFIYGRRGGATATSFDGRVTATYEAPELADQAVWGATAVDGLPPILHTPTGLFVGEAPVPQEGGGPAELSVERLPQPVDGPDMSDNITDVYVGDNGLVGVSAAYIMGTVHHTTQNIAVYEGFEMAFAPGRGPATTSHEGGWVFREDLAQAFKPNGNSIFGDERPVSLFLQEGGFDEDTPMLVVTVDPGIQASQLWLVELNGTVASATRVNDINLIDEARQVRCLDGICAVSAYGSGFGFGGITFFQWDGADGFTQLSGVSGRSIGIDMTRGEAGSVLIGRTLFQSDSYGVYELSTTTGEVLNSVFLPAPDGCTGPGHLRFRAQDEVVITCNTSGLVTSETFEFPPAG